MATGGLGPTADDLTREVLARVSGRELVLDEPTLEHIRRLFARFKRDMPERNRVQALFPAGSRIIPNPNGTAPGILLDVARSAGGACRIFALPGVPAEMFEMFKHDVAPAVLERSVQPRIIRHRRIKCFGAGESHVEAMLPDLIRRGRRPSVGITVSDATITLRITADGATADECLAAAEPTAALIRESLGSLVFGEEDDELEDSVARLLAQGNKTLATIECAVPLAAGPRDLAPAMPDAAALAALLQRFGFKAAQFEMRQSTDQRVPGAEQAVAPAMPRRRPVPAS